MGEAFGAISTIAVILFIIIAILAPVWLYLINKYTYQTRQELRATNKALESIRSILGEQNDILKAAAPIQNATKTELVEMECPECGNRFKYHNKHSKNYKNCPKCEKLILLK